MRLLALAGIVTGLTLGVAGQAGAAVLFDQVPQGSFTVPSVWSVDALADGADSQAADDFDVADGHAWVVESVSGYGFSQGAAGTNTGRVTLYAGGSTTPGPEIFSQSGIALDGGTCASNAQCDFTAPVSGAPTLLPGAYWVSIQSIQAPGSYGWRQAINPPEFTYGLSAVFQNPGDVFNTGCTTWRTVLDCGFTDSTEGRDLYLRINGTLIDSRFSIGNFTARRIKLFANPTFPAAGTLAIGGKGVKRNTASVAAGAQRIRVKLKGGVVDRLRKGRKAKLSVSMTFTATGGDAYTQTAKIKLVPRRLGAFRVAG